MNKRAVFLIAILALAAVLRFYRLGVIPYGYTWDEAAITYNAWSISLWGKDEWGMPYPVSFKSFGDYKAPLMIYTLAIPFKFFGVSENLVRFVAAFSGLATVIGTYYIARELFLKNTVLALTSAIFVAISPWGINLSRVGFEANLAVALVIWGTYALLKSNLASKIFGTILLALSAYTYHSPKIIAPFIFISILVSQKQTKRGQWIALLIVFASLITPTYVEEITRDDMGRIRTLAMFNDESKLRPAGEAINTLIKNTRAHLSPTFWIFGQDAVGLRHLVPGSGVVYKTQLIFLLTGISILLKKRTPSNKFLLLWLVCAALPSILSRESPHAVRALMLLPGISLTSAVGLHALINWFPNIPTRKIGTVVIVILIGIELSTYLSRYYTSYARESANHLQYGYKEALTTAKLEIRRADKTIITTHYGQPYIYVLLYNRIHPQDFRSGGLANFEFRPIAKSDFDNYSDAVFIGTPQEIFPSDPRVVQTITIPETNDVRFVIAKVKENQ